MNLKQNTNDNDTSYDTNINIAIFYSEIKTKKLESTIESIEMKILRAVAEYRKLDRSRNYVRKELAVQNKLAESVKKMQDSRMPKKNKIKL